MFSFFRFLFWSILLGFSVTHLPENSRSIRESYISDRIQKDKLLKKITVSIDSLRQDKYDQLLKRNLELKYKLHKKRVQN